MFGNGAARRAKREAGRADPAGAFSPSPQAPAFL